MKRINEIFHSLQGEGRNAGVAAVFVRFAGCNLSCPFCDTDHRRGTPMTDAEIVEAIAALPPVPLIVLTGGEPALQLDDAFIASLHDAFPDAAVAVETNGTRPLPPGIDWVTISPKDDFITDGSAVPVLSNVDELKVVYTGQPLAPYFQRFSARHYYLQPCASGDAAADAAATAATVEAVKADPRWRLSLQTHKLIHIP